MKPFFGAFKKELPENNNSTDDFTSNPGLLGVFLDISASFILALDKKGVVTYVNKKGADILGLPPEKITGKNWIENFIPEENAAQARAAFGKIISGRPGRFEHFEGPVLGAKGRKFLIAWNNSPARDGKKKITGMISSGVDITALKECNERLKQSVDKYEVTMETATSAIASVDAAGRILEYNRAAAEIFGINKTEMLGKPITSIMTPESVAKAMGKLKLVQARGHSYGGGYRIRTKKGDFKDIIISSAGIKDKDGKFIKTISVVEDITQRKYLEGVLRDSEEKYRTIFNAVNDAVFVHRLSGDGEISRFIAVNELACTRLGYRREELLKIGIYDITPPENLAAVKIAIKRMIKEGSLNREAVHMAKDGKRIPVEINAGTFMLGKELTAIATARDITERKISEKAAAEQAVFLELRGRLWQLASNKAMPEDTLIQTMLEMIGPPIGADRVAFGRPDNDKFRIREEWLNNKKKISFKNFVLPVDLYNKFQLSGQKVYDSKTILDDAPRNMKKTLTLLMRMIRRVYGDKPSLVTPYLINGRREGVIICTPASADMPWSADKRQIIREAADIVSNVILVRRSDRHLEQVQGSGRSGRSCGKWRRMNL